MKKIIRILRELRLVLWVSLGNCLPNISRLPQIRWRFYRMAGIIIDGPSRIFGPLIIEPSSLGAHVEIQSHCFINSSVRFGCNARIRIGRGCAIGPNVAFETANHALSGADEGRPVTAIPIEIGENVWIGSGAIILPGVVVGDGAVIAAGSVVTRNVDPGHLVCGVPAKPVRNLHP